MSSDCRDGRPGAAEPEANTGPLESKTQSVVSRCPSGAKGRSGAEGRPREDLLWNLRQQVKEELENEA